MSDAAWTILGQFIVAVGGGGVIVAVIHSLLYPKAKAEMRDIEVTIAEYRSALAPLKDARWTDPFDDDHPQYHNDARGDTRRHDILVEDPLVALERAALAPISDAVREGEERAVREWGKR